MPRTTSLPVAATTLLALGVALGGAGCGDSTASSGDGAATSDGAAPVDGSGTTPDAATADGATGDVPCVELGQSNLWAPVGSGLTVPRDAGKLLACVHVASVSKDALSANAQYTMHGWTAANGYELYGIQYATQGPVGTLHRSTALLYLPTGKGPFPQVAVNHGTSGMGPNCGPTHASVVADYMALPLVGHGYAVVATDYPGMGVDEGTAAYLVGEAEGLAILDGVRALRTFHDARFDARTQLTDELFLAGHSQGGQATLFAHQLYDASVGARLLGSVSWAPGFGDLRGANTVLGVPSRSVDTAMIFILMALYAHADYYGGPKPSDWLTPDAQAGLPGLLHDECLIQELSSIPSRWPTNADLFTSKFIAAAATCDFTQPSCPSFEPWHAHLQASVPGAFTSTAPALLLQGESDTTVAPYSTVCIADRLAAHKTPVTACGYANTDHLGIVDASADDALAFMAAMRAGKPAPSCKQPIAEKCP